MGFPRQDSWNGLPFPFSGHLPNPGIELVSPALAGRFFTTEPWYSFIKGKYLHNYLMMVTVGRTLLIEHLWGLFKILSFYNFPAVAAAAAKLLQSCPTLCDPTDGSPPGSPVPGILQARSLEWVAISFSNAWKWKVKVGSHLVVSDSQRPLGLQPTRLLHPWDFPGKSTGVGCHCLLW